MFPVHGNGVMNGSMQSNDADEIFKQRFPIHRACRDGDLNALSLLLQQGGNLDQSAIYTEDDQFGWTPAHWAAYFGKISCLKLLVEAGVAFQDVVSSAFQQTLAHTAAFANNGNLLQFLVQSQALIEKQMECLQKLVETDRQTTLDRPTTRFLQTPAHTAAFGRHISCLQWLLHSGSQCDKQDCMGETPLHKAARTGSLECLSVLTAHGANTQIMNNSGVTASRLASMCGHNAASQYLKQMETQVVWFNGTHPNENGDSNVSPNPAFINEGLNGGHLPTILGMNGFTSQQNGVTPLNGFHCVSTNGYSTVQSNGVNGLPNGHGSILSQNGHSHVDMETDNSSLEQHTNGFSGRPNGHISNGYSNPAFMNGSAPTGRKRSSAAFLHADDVKRMKTLEDTAVNRIKPIATREALTEKHELASNSSPADYGPQLYCSYSNCSVCQNLRTKNTRSVRSESDKALLAKLYFHTHGGDAELFSYLDSDIQQPCPFYANGRSPKQVFSSSVLEHQASIHMEHCYSLYAYNTLVAEMHGS